MSSSIDTTQVKTRTKPRRNPATICARGVIRAYQLVISPLFAPSCRYAPSCSRYALGAIGRFGVIRGGWLALVRLAGCHPWGGSGYDPVPPAPVDQDDPVGQDEMAGR